MKVTKKMILGIPVGSEATFPLDSRMAFKSVRSIACLAAVENPELGVKFKCRSDFEAMKITIKAAPIEEIQKAEL